MMVLAFVSVMVGDGGHARSSRCIRRAELVVVDEVYFERGCPARAQPVEVQLVGEAHVLRRPKRSFATANEASTAENTLAYLLHISGLSGAIT